jgi:hypothetical protein
MCMQNLHQWAILWKVYTDDNDGFFMDSPYWVYDFEPYYKDPELRLCPAAVKTMDEGGLGAFQAWGGRDSEFPLPDYWGSYGLNLWVTTNSGGGRGGQQLWRTPNIKAAGYVPMFLDCARFENICPYRTDEPPQFDGDFLQSSGNLDEMKRACLNRHNMAVNIAFLDFAVRRVRLKELWDLWWHRQWQQDMLNIPPPDWPDWMQ